VQIKEDEMDSAHCVHGEGNIYRVLVRNPEGKRPLGRCRHRWEDKIEMDLQTGWDGTGLD
jgi:hypothetical protein